MSRRVRALLATALVLGGLLPAGPAGPAGPAPALAASAGAAGSSAAAPARAGAAAASAASSSPAASAGSVSVGAAHACAVAAGRVLCWGDNATGALGDGTTIDRPRPVAVLTPGGVALDGVVGVAAGTGFTCALLRAGTVACWGANARGQLGAGTSGRSALAVPVDGIVTATAITAGAAHACALLADGTARCWGANGRGQLGDGTRADRSRPVRVTAIGAAAQIDAGGAHTCAITGSKRVVRCWGAGTSGQLGNGALVDRRRPVAVAGLAGVLDLASGSRHTCAVVGYSDGWDGVYAVVQCWGANQDHQADPDSSARKIRRPVFAAWADAYRAIDAGASHSCAITGSGVECWGSNAVGQFGDGTRAGRRGVASGLGAMDAIAAGGDTTCALLANDVFAAAAFCWGANGQGQVGDGTLVNRRTPRPGLRVATQPPAGPLDGVSVLAVGSFHACAVTGAGAVDCWGDNTVAQLGDGTDRRRAGAGRVGRISGALGLAAGTAHTCAVTTAGTVACWGFNDSGQLGDGTVNARSTPVAVRGLSAVATVAAGAEHSCAVTSAGRVRCWGANGDGQLGDGSIRDRPLPVPVAGLTDVIQVAPGASHTCALLADATVACWGGNGTGELGDGGGAPRRTPAAVPGVHDVTSVVSGDGFSCALRRDATIVCWGGAPGRPGDRDEVGGLPNPNDPAALAPFDLDAARGATAIAAGGAHLCALLRDGRVTCLGANASGQLGDGTRQARPGAVVVAGLADVSAIAAARDTTCAVAGADRHVVCWGSGMWLQLGDGLPVDAPRPVAVVRPT